MSLKSTSIIIPARLLSTGLFVHAAPKPQPSEIEKEDWGGTELLFQSLPAPADVGLQTVRTKSPEELVKECRGLHENDLEVFECLRRRLASAEHATVTFADAEFEQPVKAAFQRIGEDPIHHKAAITAELSDLISMFTKEVSVLSSRIDELEYGAGYLRSRRRKGFDESDETLVLKRQDRWILPSEAFQVFLSRLYEESFVTRESRENWQDILTDHFTDASLQANDQNLIDWVGKWAEYAILFGLIKPWIDLPDYQKGYVFFSKHCSYRGNRRTARAVKDSCKHSARNARTDSLNQIVVDIRRDFRIDPTISAVTRIL